MEDVHAAHHCGLFHERQVVDCPGNTTDLGVDLDQDLVHDRSQVLAFGDGIAQHDLGRNGKLGQEESLDVIIQSIFAFRPRHEEDDSLHVRVQLCLQFLDPCIGVVTALNNEGLRLSTLVPELLQHLIHSRSELLCNLGIAISMEDSPGFESWLFEHLVLNLAVDVPGRLLYVERVALSTALSTHDHLAGRVLEALELCGVVLELEMPQLLLLLAFGVGVEHLKQPTTLCNLAVSIGVHNLSEVLHEAEIGSHGICEPSHLAQLWQKCNLSPSLAVLVDEQRLVGLADFLIVAGLVVLLVGYL